MPGVGDRAADESGIDGGQLDEAAVVEAGMMFVGPLPTISVPPLLLKPR